jgi:hypothetical protein
VAAACTWTRERSSDQGREARDGVDEQSRVPHTRVHPFLLLYLAPLDLAAGVGFSLDWKSLSLSLSLCWRCLVLHR